MTSARTWLLVVAVSAAAGCGRLGPGTATSRSVLPAANGGGGGGGGTPSSGARPGWGMEDGKSCWTNSGGKYCQ